MIGFPTSLNTALVEGNAMKILLGCVVALSGSLLAAAPLHAQEGFFVSSKTKAGGNDLKCDECEPGVWRAQLVKYVHKSRYAHIDNPPCERDLPPWTKAIGQALYKVLTGGAPDSANITEEYLKRRQQAIDSAMQQTKIGGSVGEFLSKAEGLDKSSCEFLGIVVPKGARILRVKLGMHNDAQGGLECNVAGGNCLQFSANSAVVTDGPHVWVIAKNWSDGRLITANFRVYYRAPPAPKKKAR